MPYAASLSQLDALDDAVTEVCDAVLNGLDGQSPQLSCVFVSHEHRDRFPELAESIQRRIGTEVLLGCAGETVAGNEREIEAGPALSLWSAVLPGARLEPFHLEFERTADGIVSDGWPDLRDQASEIRAVFLLGDPFTTDVNLMIERLAEELPAVPLIGGMASGGGQPGQNALFLDRQHFSHGAAGVVMRGGPTVTPVVSQGCRPLGPNFVVTRAEDNLVFELGGKPSLDQLNAFFSSLSAEEQRLLQQGPHLGIVINEYQDSFELGDFLIANILGVQEENGAIAIGNQVRVGQTVRFHARDAVTADEELTSLLERYQATGLSAGGALLFSCNGRGTRLFAEPHHDAGLVHQRLNQVPVAGFFAQGEFGPVGGRNFIHGYTASVAIFGES
ncbi:MAG: FIST N-terminal domain-containing protein [Planctomycetaceae bacterium]